MVLLGKVWAAAMPAASDAAASAVQHTRFNMVFSSVRPSDPRQPQLPGKPVGRPASISIGAVGGIVPALLQVEQTPRPPYQLRRARRMWNRPQPVPSPGGDVNWTVAFRPRPRHGE